MSYFSFAISAAPRPEDQPLALSEARHSYFMTLHCMPGKFASGLTAEGSGGAEGAARGSKGCSLLSTPWSGVPGADAPGSVVNRPDSRGACRRGAGAQSRPGASFPL